MFPSLKLLLDITPRFSAYKAAQGLAVCKWESLQAIKVVTPVNTCNLGSARTSANKDAIIAATEGRAWRNSCDIN